MKEMTNGHLQNALNVLEAELVFDQSLKKERTVFVTVRMNASK